jgi:DNA-binding LacI/PurR family transcriptional regulator
MVNSDKIVYRDTALRISQAISDGELTGRLPGERELATRYGVSRVTIRRALALLLEANTIHRLPRKGTYVGRVPETPELSLHKRIGFFQFGTEEMGHYDSALLTGLSQRCGVAGFHLFIETFADSRELQQRLPDIVRFEKPDLVILSGLPTLAMADSIVLQGIPVLWTGSYIEAEPRGKYDCCFLDWYNWGYRAARYFIGQGHRRIAVISGDKADSENIEINRGIKAAHEEDGLKRSKDLTVHCRSASMQAGYNASLSLIELEYPDAIIVRSSVLGNGAALGVAQVSDDDVIPIITTSEQNNPKLNMYPLAYLNYNANDAVKKCWRLINRRLKHPKASPEATHPTWKF